MNDTVIANLENITKIFTRGGEHVHAVDGISLKINRGEYLAVSGSSGSGKTTLMNILGCVDNPTGGRIYIKDMDLTSAKQNELTNIRRHNIGFVFQQFYLIPTLTAIENVQLPGLFTGNSERIQRAGELLDIVEMGHRKNHLPSQLSGGEMQRVAIARALINSPDILLADEPTGNLDSVNAENIYNIFNMMNKKNLTIIVVTHNKDLAKHSHRMIELKDGKIIPH